MKRKTPRFGYRAAAAAAGAALFIPLLASPGGAAVTAPTPSYFALNTAINTTAYTMRFAGVTRYSTAGTIAQFSGVNSNKSGNNAFPFNQADMATPSKAWGNGDCPSFVGLSAGDTPADALAAAPLWENGDITSGTLNSGTGTIDIETSDPVMLLTDSARTGGNDLNTDSVRALQALKNGAKCGGNLASGVVFGGSQAVPPTAVSTFSTFFSNQVVTIAGTNRFDTARQIALIVNNNNGTGGAPVGYYPDGNPAHATSLANAVILAEGYTGADALTVAAYAAHHNVPILLTNSTALPSETSTALAAISPANVIVLGGTNAIDAPTAAAAAAAAGGATVTRIAGADRYASSVAIAENLDNVWPTSQAAGTCVDGSTAGSCYSGQEFGFARSEGSGSAHVGWPDALTEAYTMATNTNECNTAVRVAPSVEANDASEADTPTADTQVTIGGQCPNLNSSDAPATTSKFTDIPVLLTQQSSLSSTVDTYLGGLYSAANGVSTNTPATATTTGNNDGGFGFIFGGTAAISAPAELAIANDLSGGTYGAAAQGDLAPTMDATKVFFTHMPYTGYTDTNEGKTEGGGADNTATTPQACSYRNALVHTNYLAGYHPVTTALAGSVATDYQDGTNFPKTQSRFGCLSLATLDNGATAPTAAIPDMAKVLGLSISGHPTASTTLDWSTGAKQLSNCLAACGTAGPSFGVGAGSVTGSIIPDAAPGSPKTVTYTYPASAFPVTFKGTSHASSTATLSLTLTRTDNNAADGTDVVTATGTLTVVDGTTTLFTATLTGEGQGTIASGDATTPRTVLLSGFYSESGALGGFRATVSAKSPTGPTDGAISDFVIDGLAA